MRVRRKIERPYTPSASVTVAFQRANLAHAEQGMKKHYAQRDWARLERALVEMEGRMGGVLTG